MIQADDTSPCSEVCGDISMNGFKQRSVLSYVMPPNFRKKHSGCFSRLHLWHGCMFMAARRVLFGPGKPRVDSRPDPRSLGRGLTDPLTHGRGLLPAMQLRPFHRHPQCVAGTLHLSSGTDLCCPAHSSSTLCFTSSLAVAEKFEGSP